MPRLDRRALVLCLLVAGACGEPSEPKPAAPAAALVMPPSGASPPVPPLAMPAAPAAALNPATPPAVVAAPATRTPEERLRADVLTWTSTPYAEKGTSRSGIGQAAFVRAVYMAAFGTDIPATHDELRRTGKLVERGALAPGDLVFFEGDGFGPFRAKSVGIFLGAGEFAMASKERGVAVAKLAVAPWNATYKTARHVPTDPAAAAPTFDAAHYGSNRAALLRDISVAWAGTLYLQGGTTFDGIGNDEFVRSVYEAMYDTELEGTPKSWATMGEAVKREALQPGDIVLYEAVGLGKFVSQRHAGMYIGDNEFVHAVKGAAVTISKLDDPRWRAAYRAARRIDPDALARAQDARVERARAAAESHAQAAAATAARGGSSPQASIASSATVPSVGRGSAPLPSSVATSSEHERRLRDAEAHWEGTPYKIGGTTKAGVDCSAFVRAVYSEVYATDLPRTAEEQERLGAKVERADLQSGDLVFFRTQGMGPLFRSRHVGVYVGNGEFAQSSGKKGVNIARLDSYYWNKKYAAARRISKPGA